MSSAAAKCWCETQRAARRRACVPLLSPLAAHAEHHDENGNNEGRGSSDSAQQQDLAVGRSREVQPVLHGGHVGAQTLARSHARTHTLTPSHSCTQGGVTVSLGSADTKVLQLDVEKTLEHLEVQ